MTASRDDLVPPPLAALDPGFCLGTRNASTGERYGPWGVWQRGFAAVGLHGDGVRFKIHPGRAIREIPLTAVGRVEVAEPAPRLPLLRPVVLRICWNDGKEEFVTGFLLGRDPNVAEHWARILEALKAGIDPELLREQLSSRDAEDAGGVERALASAAAIHAARTADHNWDPNWRGSLPPEALGPDLSCVPTSLWAWRPKLPEDGGGAGADARR